MNSPATQNYKGQEPASTPRKDPTASRLLNSRELGKSSRVETWETNTTYSDASKENQLQDDGENPLRI